MTKICPRCKELKSHKEFSVNNRRKDSLCIYCKACVAIRSKIDYTENGKRRRQNPKRKQYKKDYGQEHKGKIAEYQGNYYQSHISEMRDYARTPKRRVHVGKYNAKRRDIEWDLSIEQWSNLVIGRVCHYCSGELPAAGCALDRKDSNLGYTVGNVIPCCTICNTLKSDILSYEEMIAVSNLLKTMRKSKNP